MKRETIDIGRLLEQTLGEMDEELCASGFQLKKDYPLTGMLVLCDEKCLLLSQPLTVPVPKLCECFFG